MELPKNITQIGEADHSCKVYIEDYVISFIKQINHLAENKDIAVALYGVRKEENGVSYLFLYGACKLNYLNQEVRHLSQAQNQEIEKLRKKYFSEYSFLGYRLLNGEMVEGIHVCEQGICRYVKGYACFYEKNDAMLAYMIDSREEEVKPEEVPQEKYEEVKQRQEERRSSRRENGYSARHKNEDKLSEENNTFGKRGIQKAQQKNREENKGNKENRQENKQAKKQPQASSKTLRRMQFSAAGMFAVLCVTGVAAASGGEKIEEWKTAAKQWVAGLTEQKLPDSDEMVAVMGNNSQTDKLVAEDKLTQAIRQENSENPLPSETQPEGTDPSLPPETQPEVADPSLPSETQPEGANPSLPPETQPEDAKPSLPPESQEPAQSSIPSSEDVQSSVPSQAAEEPPAEQPVPVTAEPVSYEIQKGDTLIGICIRTYGSDDRISEICSLNNISNPDNIKIGQKILLP